MRRFLEDLLADAVSSSAATGDAGAGGEVRCEFVNAFAKPYPSKVIAEVMGAPLADAPRLHHWSNWIQRQFDAISMATEIEPIEEAVGEFYEYATALLRARRESPGEDLISRLIEAEEEGERLSESECINLVFNVLVGGVDTSQSQLAHAVRLLAEDADQWRALTEDASLAEQAVEEALRFEPITPFTARILTEDVVYRDVSFPVDSVVMICAFTGNRDLDAAGSGAGAERFDLRAGTRTAQGKTARPLTFGAGVHYCLGANLARLELREALEFLARRVRRLELAGEPVFESVSGIYGLAELPLRFSLNC
jgi:cytochrome P450